MKSKLEAQGKGTGTIEEKEIVTRPAILMPDGKIWTGLSHNDIIEQYLREYDLIKLPIEQDRNLKRGWATNKREWVSRTEAEDIALAAGQITQRSADGKLYADELVVE